MNKTAPSKNKKPKKSFTRKQRKSRKKIFLIAGSIVVLAVIVYALKVQKLFTPKKHVEQSTASLPVQAIEKRVIPKEKWLQRAYLIDETFHNVYRPSWEGANGAIGDAYLFAVTNDSALYRFHIIEHDLKNLFNGTWLDDRAWNCLAEMYWWKFTGKIKTDLVSSAVQRYTDARDRGMLSNHEGFWSWYNWPPNAQVNEPIFTNSNMNQMISVACWLYEATHDQKFLDDALLVWNGNNESPGIEKTLYKGNGIWKGKEGRAAFGKQIPWNGAEYCSIGASLYRVTKNEKFKKIVVATAKRIMNPKNGWVDPTDFYQINMDGNGAFVHFLMDAYEIAPDELSDIPDKVSKMLEHVWSNNNGKATVTLHRQSDNGIRNGWNPNGGEDGYHVDEIGSLHAQSQAVRAFGVFGYFMNQK